MLISALLLLNSTWLIYLYYARKASLSLEPIELFSDQEISDHRDSPRPLVSVVIAVRNGEEHIEQTIANLKSSNYPNMEAIIVADRCDDRTADVVRKSIQDLQNFSLIPIDSVPKGWLGKTHALHVGSQSAEGEFVVFTDSDIHFSPDLLALAVNACQKQGLDHLSILGDVACSSFMLRLLVTTSRALFTLSGRTWIPFAERPVESVKGMGAFNMVRRRTFAASEGFPWLKMEVADDVALAQLISRNSGRSNFFRTASSSLTFSWYSNARAMMKGLEKNIVGGFTNYKTLPLLTILLFSLAAFATPFVNLVYLEGSWLIFVSVLYFASLAYFAHSLKSLFQMGFTALFLHPLGILCLGLILLRAYVLLMLRGGVYWGGMFYPLKELKAGARVRLGF